MTRVTANTGGDVRLGLRCPRCGRRSNHPMDQAEGYCGACHDWTASELPRVDSIGALGAPQLRLVHDALRLAEIDCAVRAELEQGELAARLVQDLEMLRSVRERVAEVLDRT